MKTILKKLALLFALLGMTWLMLVLSGQHKDALSKQSNQLDTLLRESAGIAPELTKKLYASVVAQTQINEQIRYVSIGFVVLVISAIGLFLWTLKTIPRDWRKSRINRR